MQPLSDKNLHSNKNAVKALTERIKSVNIDNDAVAEMLDQDIEMENIHKNTYKTFAFSKLKFIKPNKHHQLHD